MERAKPRLALAVTLCALAALLGPPAAQASYSLLDAFGTPNGEGAGQLGAVADVAVNRSGAGGAEAGDVYVVDRGNSRIQQFDAAGNVIRAFGWDIVASGPDNVTPANAVQSVNVPASVTGGTFTLTFNGMTTAPVPFNATAAEVKTALVALSSIPDGFGAGVEVTGGPGATTPYTVSFVNELSNTPVPLMSADSSGLTGGSVAISMTTPGVSNFEICDVKAHPADVCKRTSSLINTALGSVPEGGVGIAVDQASGNVYVSNSRLYRIEVFSSTGQPEGAFAWGVSNGAGELQFCITVCLRGIRGGAAGQLQSGIGYLDVGPDGRLYVADPDNFRIDEFQPTLSGGVVTGISFLRAFGWDVVASGPDDMPNITARQLLKIPSSVTGGSFTLTFEGATTNPLPYNVTYNGLFTALNGLAPVKESGGRIEPIVKGPGEWELVFERGLGNTPVPPIEVDSSELVGGAASITVLTQGQSRYEVCDVAAHPGETCKAGLPGAHGGQFGGDTNASGEANFSTLTDVAVDSSGTIYTVERGRPSVAIPCGPETRCRVQKFSPAAAFEGEFAPAELSTVSKSALPLSIAVNPADDHVFVTRKSSESSFQVLEFDSSGSLLSTSPPGAGITEKEFSLPPGIGVGTGERLYVSANKAGVGGEVFIFGPAPAPSATILPVSGIGATTATFNGTVTPPPPGPSGGFETFYHFEYSLDGTNWTEVPADEDAAVGDGTGSGDPGNCPVEDPPSCNVSQTATGLQPNASYQMRLVATTGTSTTTTTVGFSTDPAAPTVSQTVAEEVEEESATLTARVNPNSEATTYRFEWGPTTAYGNEAPLGGASAGSGGEAVKASAPIAGLEPDTAYHFRIAATNATGTTTGPDQEFLTLNDAGLPDDRRPELVSVADKRPQGAVRHIFLSQLTYQAAKDGEAFVYPILNGLLDSTAGGELRYLAKRTPSGWQSTQLSAPALVAPPSDRPPSFVHQFTPDLSCGVMESYEPLTVDTPAADLELGVTNLYRINPDGTHTLVSNTVPSNPTQAAYYNVAGTSPDCSTVYFTSVYKLLPGASGLYEWHDGVLSDAGLLPDGTPSSGPTIKPEGPNYANLVSADGSRLFFTTKSNEGADQGKQAVFMREGGSTLDVSQTQTATVPTGARYEIASADGSHLFFAANYGLAANSSSGPNANCATVAIGEGLACDLYDYDTEAGTLTDLSADANPADAKGAAVEGVLDASEDGSTVYFAALGQLVPGEGNTYKQNLAGAGFANVYRSQEGTLSHVAKVGKSDVERSLLARSIVGEWSAQATPDGSHLLFASRANVTGEESGGHRQAYLYSADSGETVCVSCRRDGQPSLGEPFDLPLAITVADQPEQNYVPRSVSDDGSRVFFTSLDALAPGAIEGNGAQNVYEWRKGQVYLLATESDAKTPIEALDSSASGRDVFIRTTQQLDPHDTDFAYDAYDLREGGGFPPPQEPPALCVPAEDTCQGTPTPPPGASTPASAGFSGPGNPPLRKQRKAHRKRKKHRKHKHARKGRHGRAANAKRRGSK